jgi:hypothetical protein
MGAMRITRKSLALVLCLAAVSCTSSTSPNPDDPNTPKNKNISVQYIRLPPIDYIGPDVVHLIWNFTNYSGRTSMARTAEDNFSCGAQIRTETRIYMTVEDVRKYSECNYYTRKRLFIDGYELVFDGSACGGVEFIYHNNGNIEITNPTI